MLKKIVIFSALAVSAYSSSCWTSLEISKLAVYDMDKAKFSIKDSVTCEPVANATVTVGSRQFQADTQGIVRVTLPDSFDAPRYTIEMKKRGYISRSQRVDEYDYLNPLVLMSKELPINSARFVLSWAKKPRDLDLHLKSNSYHISYRKTKSIINKVKLDRDATKGYGPETITVDKLKSSETYRVIIHKFSNDSGKIDKQTQVSVYLNNKLDNIVSLQSTDARCLEVATINNNQIIYRTKKLSTSECK